MFRHVLIILAIIYKYNCGFTSYAEYFVIDDHEFNNTVNCSLLDNSQYYLYNSGNISATRKLTCLSGNLGEAKYFPKCCPPNYVYERKDHKCVESNFTNIYENIINGSLLIRNGLSQCKMILDHVIEANQQSFPIEPNGSAFFKGKLYHLGSYCMDYTNEKNNTVIRTCEDIEVCRSEGVRCIKKCCADGKYYEGNICYPGYKHGLSLTNMTRFKYKNEYYNAVLVSDWCSRYLDKPRYTFQIEKDGTTAIRELGVWTQYLLEENYYCIEYVGKLKEYKMLLCNLYDKYEQHPSKPIVNKVALIISCTCLLVTVILYLILPDLKNFIGKIIICYCSCLFIAFLSLTWLQFDPIPGDYCDVFGFVIAFFFLAAFSWMTILSYEMWRVLGSMTAHYGNKLTTHRKRFLWYNFIGWAIPLGMISFTLLDYLYYFLPNPIHITVGYRQCVLENQRARGTYGHTFHFAVPCGLYLLINSIIFVKTITYIYRVKNEIDHIKVIDIGERRKKWMILNTDKERLKMVIRIFLVMGVNFLFETFSAIFVDFSNNETLKIVELIFDTFNALQGVFILCIFLVKKKTWNSIREFVRLSASSRKSSIATGSTEVVTAIKSQHLNNLKPTA